MLRCCFYILLTHTNTKISEIWGLQVKGNDHDMSSLFPTFLFFFKKKVYRCIINDSVPSEKKTALFFSLINSTYLKIDQVIHQLYISQTLKNNQRFSAMNSPQFTTFRSLMLFLFVMKRGHMFPLL